MLRPISNVYLFILEMLPCCDKPNHIAVYRAVAFLRVAGRISNLKI
jgi:hypothetical protein